MRQFSRSLRFRWTELDATVLQGEIQFHGKWCNGLTKDINLDIQLGPTSWCKINIAKLRLDCMCIHWSSKTWGKICPVLVLTFFFYRLLKLPFLNRHISFIPQLVTDCNTLWHVSLKLPHCADKSDKWSIVRCYLYLCLAAFSVEKISSTLN